MKTESSLFLTDIVESILAKFAKDYFPTDRNFFHSYIYECKNTYPDLLKGFIFDEMGGHPHSREVEDALTNLEIASLLGQKNPDFTTYEIKANLKEHYSKYIKKELLPDEEKQIKEIADGLLEKLNEWDRNR